MKLPDEIKKGLECCTADGGCKWDNGCPYGGHKECAVDLKADALALIRQLEAQNTEKAEKIRVLESRNNALYYTILGVMRFVDKWLDVPAYDPDEDLNGTTAVGRASHAREIALQAIEQLEAERDALFKEVRGRCTTCEHFDKEPEEEPCNSCVVLGGEKHYWQWRGAQKEE